MQSRWAAAGGHIGSSTADTVVVSGVFGVFGAPPRGHRAPAAFAAERRDLAVAGK
jgi:hypothetical protein